MPKIQWRDLPTELRQHLFDRAKERGITAEDLFALAEWREHSLIQAPRRGPIPEDFPAAGSTSAWRASRVGRDF